jgi:hypothetical protein
MTVIWNAAREEAKTKESDRCRHNDDVTGRAWKRQEL